MSNDGTGLREIVAEMRERAAEDRRNGDTDQQLEQWAEDLTALSAVAPPPALEGGDAVAGEWWLATHPRVTAEYDRGRPRLLQAQHLKSYIAGGWTVQPATHPAPAQPDFTPTGSPQECDTLEEAVMLAEHALWQDDKGVRWVPEAAYQRAITEIEALEGKLFPMAAPAQPEEGACPTAPCPFCGKKWLDCNGIEAWCSGYRSSPHALITMPIEDWNMRAPAQPEGGEADLLDDVANALANYSLLQKSTDPVGHQLTMALRDKFRAYRDTRPAPAQQACPACELGQATCGYHSRNPAQQAVTVAALHAAQIQAVREGDYGEANALEDEIVTLEASTAAASAADAQEGAK